MARRLNFTLADVEYPREAQMKTTAYSLLIAATLFFGSGCRHLFHEPDFEAPSAPTGLRTATGDNFIELFWNSSREPDVAGYNVYVSSSYNGRYTLIGSTYDTYYVDDGAANGSIYYYAVSAYDYDGNEGDLSTDVAYDIPRPEGYDVTLMSASYSASQSGYDFSRYSVVPANDQYADMVYNGSNGSMGMSVSTDTDIQDMGPTRSILDIGQAPASGWSNTHSVELVAGHTYVVWTWDDHYAKFRVSALSQNRVVFDWAYQLIPANRLMKRSVPAVRETTK
jgi:hypothetical protein